MSSFILPVITDAGVAAAINAEANGLQLEITHVVLGLGHYTPGPTSVITNRVEKAAIASSVPMGPGQFLVSVFMSSYLGVPYNVSEIGFYAGDPDAGGVLFAVYSHPSNIMFQRNALDWVGQFAMRLTRVPEGSVTVTVDPTAAIALALMASHLAAANPHPQYQQQLNRGWRVGDVKYTDNPEPQEGWINGNNGLVLIADFPELFAVLGTRHGGDGVTNFRLPELRAEFLVGLDDGRGIDPGRLLGSNAPHNLPAHMHQWFSSGAPGGPVTIDATGWSGTGSWHADGWLQGFYSDPIQGNWFTSPELYHVTGDVRPRSIALRGLIKYA